MEFGRLVALTKFQGRVLLPDNQEGILVGGSVSECASGGRSMNFSESIWAGFSVN